MSLAPPRRDEFAAYCLELLAPLGPCSARRMFGGHGIYLDGVMIGLIAYERLYLKTDEQSLPRWREAGCEPFVYDGKGKPVTMSYWTPPQEAMESPALMQPWARLALEAAVRARSAKAARKPPARRPAARKAK
ncbi:TfoX/Sxy family protein [Methylibium rhizosphaerae]|jgi:DNA transformation protein|uniref:TfoX/Sxy family protein n=1 Tax=Methylibium rhizosphaerae TaxID=2570323 RepID=UPI0011281AD0|nr:TfoX/Sxy family protein [Methylibium rhizosphaerae]